VGYEHIFEIIRPFQDKQIRDDILAKYEAERGDNIDASRSRKTASRKDFTAPENLPGADKTFNGEKVV